MENSGEPTGGTILPHAFEVRAICRDEVAKALDRHLALCPFATSKIDERLRRVELRLSTLVGLLLGSGAIGGISGAIVTALLKTL
jgi:hypothetical protein